MTLAATSAVAMSSAAIVEPILDGVVDQAVEKANAKGQGDSDSDSDYEAAGAFKEDR